MIEMALEALISVVVFLLMLVVVGTVVSLFTGELKPPVLRRRRRPMARFTSQKR